MEIPVLCHRCGATLTPGRETHYIVRIEAFADPTPAAITEADLRDDVGVELERLVDEAAALSGPELMDQVHRRLVVRLCWPCYKHWIENPVG